jgi:hypothetical protein
VFVAAAVALAFVLAFLSFLRSGGFERLARPEPLAGRESFELTLVAERVVSADDAEAMVFRVRSLGAGAEVVTEDGRSITLRISHAAGREAVVRALAPRGIRLHFVRDLLEDGDPSLAGLGLVRPPEEAPRSASGDCGSVDAWRREHTDDAACLYRVERMELADGRSCILHCLAPAPVITAGDIVDASVMVNDWDGMPSVAVVLGPEAADSFGAQTARHVNQLLAIVVDDQVVAVPVVSEAIPSGRLQLSVSRGASFEDAIVDAKTLAAALRPEGRISTPWTARGP